MKKVYLFDLNAEHFKKVGDLILPFYNEDPLNFLFLGPSGFYVKQVAEYIASQTQKTINRDGFRVINQYVTETLKTYQPQSVILDRDFLKVYIENEIMDLIEEEKKDEEFSEYLNVISKSQKSVEYILDIFEKKWEISRVEDEEIVESSEEYKLLDDSIDNNSNLYILYTKLEKKLEDILETKFDMSIKYQRNYDPVSVYKWFYEILPTRLKEEGKKYIGKRVVISGFFDISPAVNKTLKAFFDLFEEVHFITWVNIEDRSFDSITNIHNFLKNEGFEFKSKRKGLKGIFENTNIQIFPMNNDVSEIEILTKEIKRKLISENLSPDDFGIVVPNNSTAKLLADHLEDAKVPYRFKNDVPLNESQIVLMLLQPIKTLVRGCEVEDILAMIESGYGGVTELTMEQIENYLKRLNLFYDIQKSFLKNRKEKWMNTIEKEIEKRKAQLKGTEEIERISEELKGLRELKKCLGNIFSLLENIQKSKDRKRYFSVSDYRELVKEWIDTYLSHFNILKTYEDVLPVESELNALKAFEALIFNVEENLEKILKSDKNLGIEKFYKILSSLIQIETYRESERYDNTVEIMSLEDSRFVKKKYKYFVGFTEENYPSIKVNPFITSMSNEGTSIAKHSEKISRRNLFISMIFAENIVFTYPNAKLSGEPILPSPYEKEFRNNFKNVKYSSEFLSKKEILPKDPDNIFSETEATIYYILNGKKEYLSHKHFTNIERLKKEITNPQWQLSKNTGLGRLSHTKITTYVDCPFKYYLGIEGRLYGDKAFEKFFDGLIKHRVMKEIFSKYKNYEVMSQKILNKEELKEEIKNIIEDIWEEYTDDFLLTYQAIKDVESEIITEDILESIEDIHRKYIHFKKGVDLTYSQVIATELEINSKINIENFHDVDLTSRIDRVDLLNGNYAYLLDEFDDQLLPGAYSIMDYKRSKNFQSEQLLIYYLTLLNNEEWKNKLANSDVYLKFQVVSKKKDHKNSNFIKIQKGRIIYKEHKSKAKYVSFDIKEFYTWLEKVFQNINKSDFTPIAVKEREIRRFLEEMYDKYNNAKTGEKYYDCSSCQFRSLCELIQYKKDFNMNIKKYL